MCIRSRESIKNRTHLDTHFSNATPIHQLRKMDKKLQSGYKVDGEVRG